MPHLMKVMVLFSILSSIGYSISAEEITAQAEQVRGPDGAYSFQVRVKDYEKGKLQKENLYQVYSKNRKFTLIETIFPERQSGRKLLMAGGLWLYLPSLKRPTRVASQQRLTGEVSNGDIAKTNFHQDYHSRLLGLKKIKGESLYHLELLAKDNKAPYRKIHLFVERSTFIPRRADFFAISGKLLKTGEYSELKNVFGKPRLTKLVIKDAIQPSKQSHLLYSNFKREKLDDSFFNKDALGD